jgi:mono/diheme cytochrome c family protein
MRAATSKSCQRILSFLAALMVAAALGCSDFPGKPNPADKPIMPDQVLAFEKLFANNCAGCHGSDGSFGPAPPLNDPLFIEIISREQLAGVVENGRPGTPMPPFSKTHGGPLTDEQIVVLVDGIRSRWSAAKHAENSLPPYVPSESEGALAGNAERGAELFSRACAGCHGANGLGKVREGVATKVINSSAFLSLISDHAIRRIIITGRPDLGMPSFAERIGRPNDFQPLTPADINDLVALLADWRTAGGTAAISAP